MRTEITVKEFCVEVIETPYGYQWQVSNDNGLLIPHEREFYLSAEVAFFDAVQVYARHLKVSSGLFTPPQLTGGDE